MYKEHYLACITYGVDSMWEFKNLVADFYFDNSLEDTMNEFSLSPSGVQKMFKEVYGGYSKGSCLGVTDSTVARYYLDHSKQETMEELNVSASKVINSFLHVYGISKRKYIKKVGN